MFFNFFNGLFNSNSSSKNCDTFAAETALRNQHYNEFIEKLKADEVEYYDEAEKLYEEYKAMGIEKLEYELDNLSLSLRGIEKVFFSEHVYRLYDGHPCIVGKIDGHYSRAFFEDGKIVYKPWCQHPNEGVYDRFPIDTEMLDEDFRKAILQNRACAHVMMLAIRELLKPEMFASRNSAA